MDNAYRFGKVEVSCEGYDYPDDPYVLRGSCGVCIKTSKLVAHSNMLFTTENGLNIC